MSKKTVPKKNKMDAFYSLKNNPVFTIVQSCCSVFPRAQALGSADQQIARLPPSLLNKSPTFTKLSLVEIYLGGTVFSDQAFPSSGFSFCASGIPEMLLASGNLASRRDNNALFVRKSCQTKPCYLTAL